MLIGFNLAPVVANVYWPQDQWVALATLAFVMLCMVLLPGFWGRIAILADPFGHGLCLLQFSGRGYDTIAE